MNTRLGELLLVPKTQWVPQLEKDRYHWHVLVVKTRATASFGFNLENGILTEDYTDLEANLGNLPLGEENYEDIDDTIVFNAQTKNEEMPLKEYLETVVGYDLSDLIRYLATAFPGKYRVTNSDEDTLIIFDLDEPIRHIGRLSIAMARKINEWADTHYPRT